mmetsp:Transcript_29185/g.83646  ORF Transcript_29185/g.83646 Transcript_29185/m.83646 type:complete len:230 (+) Transcript_29185:160-849(+)
MGSMAAVAITAVWTFTAGARMASTRCFKVYITAHRALGFAGEPCINALGMIVVAARQMPDLLAKPKVFQADHALLTHLWCFGIAKVIRSKLVDLLARQVLLRSRLFRYAGQGGHHRQHHRGEKEEARVPCNETQACCGVDLASAGQSILWSNRSAAHAWREAEGVREQRGCRRGPHEPQRPQQALRGGGPRAPMPAFRVAHNRPAPLELVGSLRQANHSHANEGHELPH